MEEKGQLLKSIGFPIKLLACIDKAAATIYRTSRSALVVKATKEFVKNHNLEKKTKIDI